MVSTRLMINWCVWCVLIFDHLTCQRLYLGLLHLMTFMTLLNCVVQYSFTLYILLSIWLFMNQFIHVFFILVMDYHPHKLTARSVTILWGEKLMCTLIFIYNIALCICQHMAEFKKKVIQPFFHNLPFLGQNLGYNFNITLNGQY